MGKDIKTMQDLVVHHLEDIYYAAERVIEILPRMIEKAHSPYLRQALKMHLAEKEDNVKRIEEVFQMHGLEPRPVNCLAIDGIIEEADEVTDNIEYSDVLDVALIAAAQAVEHYEITRYGALIAWTKQLRGGDCANLLQQNLDKAKSADRMLSDLAERRVNPMAIFTQTMIDRITDAQSRL
jgi:ferritin-like metal-binding protein YciE